MCTSLLTEGCKSTKKTLKLPQDIQQYKAEDHGRHPFLSIGLPSWSLDRADTKKCARYEELTLMEKGKKCVESYQALRSSTSGKAP